MGVFIFLLQTGAVPTMGTQLILALVDGDLHALYRRRRDVRKLEAEVILWWRQIRVGLADGIRVQVRLCWDVQSQNVIGKGTGGKRDWGKKVEPDISDQMRRKGTSMKTAASWYVRAMAVFLWSSLSAKLRRPCIPTVWSTHFKGNPPKHT